MNNEIDEKDTVDHALDLLVLQGRVVKTQDEDGRTVYKMAESN